MNFTDALKLARQKRCAITRDDFKANNPNSTAYIQHGMDNVFFITTVYTNSRCEVISSRQEMIWSVADLLHEGYELAERYPYSYLRDRIDKLKSSPINRQGHNEAPITPKPNIKPPAQKSHKE